MLAFQIFLRNWIGSKGPSLIRSLRKLKNVDLLHWLKNGSGDGGAGRKQRY